VLVNPDVVIATEELNSPILVETEELKVE
jgi:hypothetical protein